MAVILCIRVHRATCDEGVAESETSFDELYTRWYPEVVGLCRRLSSWCGDPEATAQEAFIRAWMALDRYSAARPFWPWVSVIARRLCLDDRRRFLRQTAHELPAPLLVDEQHPERLFELRETANVVAEAIDRLRPAERRAFVLREFEGWSYQEIADFEGTTLDAIRGSLKRARSALRRAVCVEGVDSPARIVLSRGDRIEVSA